MSWFASLRDTAKAGLTLDRTLSDPRRAVRGAVAVALVVFPTLALAGPSLATSAAMGAFIAGTATFQRSFRPRTSLAVAAGLGLGISTFLGYLAVGVPGAFPVLLALWSFGAGMMWAIGPTGGVVAATTVSVMLVVVQLPVSVETALGHGALCAVGGAAQALVVTLWPVDSWGAQRDALADTYAALADYARRLRQDPTAHVDPEPFILARQAAALTPWQARHRPPEMRGLRGIAERVRPALAALADPRVGAAAEGPERDRAREILAAAAEVLDALARAVRSGDPYRPPRSTPALALLRPDEGPGLRGAARRSARRLSGLLGKAVDNLDKQDRSTVTGPARGPGLHRPPLLRVVPSALRTVRRQLDPHAAVFQHAVRLSCVVTGAYLAARLLGVRHGYWAPLTAAMVMRPDFAQTYSRGVARLAGTVAGVLVATLVVRLADPGEWVSAALAVVFIAGAYLTLRTGYALATACISGYVVFLLGLEDVDPTQTAVDRIAMTLLGGALALGAYALFPTWQTARLPERLAEWLAAVGRYAAAVVAALGEPDERHTRIVRDTLLDVREARSEMLEAQQRADAEPHRDPDRLTELPRKQLDRARAAVGLLGRSTVLMEAHLPAADSPPLPGTAAFAEELRDSTAIAAAAILLGHPADFSALRAAHETWDEVLATLPPETGAEDRVAVARGGARLLMQAVADLEKAVRPRRVAGPVPSKA
ncbi:FUSC family protein [Kitasatospora sp. NPDC048540]|uniref:FUSC family protein n=1 Tax=unclassified Kitasatospora TaxID=2633591 RepID=UPI00053A7E36|nr:FUSC family protein [Kitasatospora sp. MBT63]